MADNTELNTGSGGNIIRDVEKAGAKTQVILLDIGGLGVESLFTGEVSVSNFPASQAVTGTFFQATQPVSAAALPLPTGAATEAGNLATIAAKDFATSAKQDTGNTSLSTIAGKDFATQATLALVSTAAKQDTGNTSLSSIDGKTPALGQALAADSVPVVLTSAQLATLTPLSSVTANAGSNLNTSLLALEAGGNLATIAGKDFATQTTLALIKAKTDNIPPIGQAVMAASTPVVIASDQGAIPITGSISATSAATASSIPPSYSEGVSNALSQDLAGNTRVSDRSNNEYRSDTNDLLRLILREMWCLRMGFMRELRDMPDPNEYEFNNPLDTIQ
jgi:hypothetical protein